jgi:hypothetical protein
VTLRRMIPHIVGLVWVLGAAGVTLAPALHHGLSLGSYDILSRSGLTQVPGASAHNTESGDQIAEMIPWSTLAWDQVHQGHLPLWNSFNGLGLPLAFNWQSAAFSLPALVGYMLPLHLAYTAQILVTLVVAGTGAYVLARVLGLGVIGCATAGTVYELSGSFMGWLGWPHAGVMSWAGWLFAVAILLLRGRRHRTRNIVAFAVLVALAVYAGEPEIFVLLLVSLVIFALTTLIVMRAIAHNTNRSMRALIDLSVATLVGLGLSAPLALPGLQVLARSTRNSGTLFTTTEVDKALPPDDLVHLLVQGYNGLPLAGSQVFGDAVYTDTAAYVGIIAVALAVLGIVRNRRRPEAAGFAVLAVVTLAIVYAPPIEAVFVHLPLVRTVDWHRDLMIVGLCIAILAGLGMDALVRTPARKSTQLIVGGVLTGGLVLLLVLWLWGTSGLSQLDAGFRRDSLGSPLVTGGLALVVVAALAVRTARGAAQLGSGVDHVNDAAAPPGPTSDIARRQRHRSTAGQVAGVLLLLLETAFLVGSGAQLWSSSANGVRSTPAVDSLASLVGNSTVGFGAVSCYLGPGVSTLGILPESNILFGVHEFDFYDPILPRGYLESWAELSKSNPAVLIYNSFCPALTTAAEARRYGVKFVLESDGAAPPTGGVLDGKVGDELLYRIPDSSEAELIPLASMGHLPPSDALGTPVKVDRPSPSSLRITTSSHDGEVLRLRLTNEPGWHATIDGRPLQLQSFADVMLQARIPGGHHVIELHYWPTLFTVGLIVAASCLGLLLVLVLVSAFRRRTEPEITE